MGESEKSDSYSVYWDFLLDDSNERYDFKHFSPSCAELAANYTEQARKMFELMYGYLRGITKKQNGK
jgi:hypothetical protein